jgi:enoyl-CoA hydratase
MKNLQIMAYNNIIAEQKGQILWITINRPSQLNALNKETIQELRLALDAANNDSKTGVVILTGSGEKSFVAGADIKEFADFDTLQGKELAAKGQALLFDFIENIFGYSTKRFHLG